MRLALLFLTLALLAPAEIRAADKIWSALVVVTPDGSRPIPEKLEPFMPALRKAFGHDYAYILGEKSKFLTEGESEWLVPSKEFFFHVACESQLDANYLVHLELYQKKQLLLRAEASLAKQQPLLVRGPQWGKEQLVIVLTIQ